MHQVLTVSCVFDVIASTDHLKIFGIRYLRIQRGRESVTHKKIINPSLRLTVFTGKNSKDILLIKFSYTAIQTVKVNRFYTNGFINK